MSLEEVCSQRRMRHRALDVQFWPYQVASLPSSHSDHSVSLQASSFSFSPNFVLDFEHLYQLKWSPSTPSTRPGSNFCTAMGWMIHIKMCGRLGAWLWTLWLIYRWFTNYIYIYKHGHFPWICQMTRRYIPISIISSWNISYLNIHFISHYIPLYPNIHYIPTSTLYPIISHDIAG